MKLDAGSTRLIELFAVAGQSFRIPLFQRDFAWGKAQLDDFWNDLTEADGSHFVGSLVFHKRDHKTYDVIDGQQRLTTMLILLGGIRDTYVALESEDDADLINSLFVSRFKATGDDRWRFRSGRKNWPVLRDVVLRKPDDELRKAPADIGKSHSPEKHANRQLLAAIRWVRRTLTHDISKRDDRADKLSRLAFLEESITERFEFVRIDVESLKDAFRLFESLNDRGLQLSAADLLKNLLLGEMASKESEEAVYEAAIKWDHMVESLQGAAVTAFLRHYLLMFHDRVTKAKIFDVFEGEVRTAGAKKQLAAISQFASHYGEIHDPEACDHPALRTALGHVKSLSVVSSHILLMAGRELLADDDYLKLVRMVEVMNFRWSTVGGLNAQELETIYHKAAKRIREERTLVAARTVLAKELPTDGQLTPRLRLQRMSDRGIMRHVLVQVERAIDHGSEKEIKSASEVHIEHILPEAAKPHWEAVVVGVPQDRINEVTQMWGNLTLLKGEPNISISNKAYSSTKRHEYLKSSVKLTTDVAETFAEWTLDTIEQRQRWLSAAVLGVWSFEHMVDGQAVSILTLKEMAAARAETADHA